MSANTTLDPAATTLGGSLGPAEHGPPGRVTWELRDGRPVVVKRATGRDRGPLRREAAVLRSLGGSNVVRVLDLGDVDDRTELVLAAVEGPTLASVIGDPTIGPADGIRVLADMCDAVARLHAHGWTHGDLRAEHVLVSPRGRIRFCSLASAAPVDLASDGGRADRAAALRLVDEWTDATASLGGPPWRRVPRTRLVRQVRRRTMRLVDDPDPMVLARVLRRTTSRPRRPHAVASAAAVVALVAATWLASFRDRTAPDLRAAGPVEAARDRPDVSIDGNDVSVQGVQYRIGAPGDVVAVADWDCDGNDTAMVLRPRSGEIFEFTDWARPGAPTSARRVGSVPGARSIDAPADRCGPARLTLQDGSRQTLGGDP
jgi:hypothetical protein